MLQLSRPFQVVMLVFALLVLAWFVVLHRPGGGSATGSSSPSVASSAGGSSAHNASSASVSGAGSGRVYHGPAPGVEGLTRDIKRAHEAAAEEGRGGQTPHSAAAGAPRTGAASDPRTAAAGDPRTEAVRTAAGGTTAGSSRRVPTATRTHTGAPAGTSGSLTAAARARAQRRTSGSAASSSTSKATAVTPQRTSRTHSGSAAAAPAAGSAPPMQAAVAGELAQGKVVLLLFWNPHSSDDVAVNQQVQAVAHTLGRRVAVHTASASQVGSFGSITREVQVYQTPTLLIVNTRRQVTTLTGYTDAFAIEQAIAEARS